MRDKSLMLIGCGALGSALLRRLLSFDFFQKGVTIVTPRQESAAPFLQDSRVSWKKNPESSSDIVLFAVKPHQLKEVLPVYKPLISEKTLVISVCAGVPLSFFSSVFGERVPLSRTMPNTPCAIGEGITLGFSRNLSVEQCSLVRDFFQLMGVFCEMESEEALDKATTLTGCGPAYVYLFMECLQKAAQELGLNEAALSPLVQQLFLGSLHYLEKTGKSPLALRQEVTSPNGVTFAALQVFQKQGELDALCRTALAKAYERTLEMRHDS